MPLQFYNIENICNSTGFSRGGIYKQIKNGLFPHSIKWGNCARWLSEEVDAVFEARAAGKSDTEIRALVKSFDEKRAEMV